MPALPRAPSQQAPVGGRGEPRRAARAGIGRSISRVEQIDALQRPLTMEDGGVVLMDLLWSDPTTNDGVEGVQPSPRGPGLVTFGPDRVTEFCKARGWAGAGRGRCVLVHACTASVLSVAGWLLRALVPREAALPRTAGAAGWDARAAAGRGVCALVHPCKAFVLSVGGLSCGPGAGGGCRATRGGLGRRAAAAR